MSFYIRTYQERQRIRAELKKIRQKADPDTYLKLKEEEKNLTEMLTQIIKSESK